MPNLNQSLFVSDSIWGAIKSNNKNIADMIIVQIRKISEFINGYQSERKLTDNENEYLNSALRLAALRFWLSRLEDFHNAKEGEITFIKDPNHFKDILVNRQTMRNYAN